MVACRPGREYSVPGLALAHRPSPRIDRRGALSPVVGGVQFMSGQNTYVKTEVVGTSDVSISQAINNAIGTASQSLRNLEWFEVIEMRGSIRDGKAASYQVTLKLGLRYDTPA
jgi:flavin-binding protein dodecin